MMGFGPSDARELTYWEYTAMLEVWNARHNPEQNDLPDPDFVRAQFARLKARAN